MHWFFAITIWASVHGYEYQTLDTSHYIAGQPACIDLVNATWKGLMRMYPKGHFRVACVKIEAAA